MLGQFAMRRRTRTVCENWGFSTASLGISSKKPMFTKSLYVQVLDSRSHLEASLHKQITEDSQVFRLVVNNEDVASGSLRRIHGLDATTVRLIIE